MRLFYRISERPLKRVKTSHPQTVESKSGSGIGVNNANSDLTNTNNKANSGVVSQSKLVQTSSCTSRTTASTPIMTGAASVPTFKTHNSGIKSNNSGNSVTTGVSSAKASSAKPSTAKSSTTTPRRTDHSKSSSITSTAATASTGNQAVSAQPTPPGKGKKLTSANTSVCAVQTDEPPKKLRKTLPNNSSESTPKPVPTTAFNAGSANNSGNAPPTPKTSSSTVTSLRQCRINLDKSKLGSICLSTATSTGSGPTSASCQSGSTTASSPSARSDACKAESTEVTDDSSAKKNSGRKCSAFDVRTLIGTKSPTLQCKRQSEETLVSERNDESSESKSGSQLGKQSKANSREVNRIKGTSNQSSMPSTTTSSGSKKAANSPSVALSRPPTNKSTTPNDRVSTPDDFTSIACLPSKQSKSAANVSQKGSKTLQNESSLKSCNARDATRDITRGVISDKISKTSIKPLSVAKCEPQQRQSTPLSPTSIRIKLPPPPQSADSLKDTHKDPHKDTHRDSHKTSSKSSANKTQNQVNKTSESITRDEKVQSKSLVSKPDSPESDRKDPEKSKLMTNGSALSGIKSAASSGGSKTKGAAINQIVNKIASGVTAKSASVNVTSTTPALELNKSESNATSLSAVSAVSTASAVSAVQLSSGSNEITPNDVNDDRVSTTTGESNTASIHKSEASIKSVSAVTSAATNSGNLVIRISTKTHSVESIVSPKDRERKFEIKKDSPNTCAHVSDHSRSHAEDKKFMNDNQIKTSGDNDEEDDEIDGKLVVDVPNDDNSSESDINSNGSKVTSDSEPIVGTGQRANTKSAHSSAQPVKANRMADKSTKLAINISTAHQLSATSAVLASPPPTPTPSPKSESDPIALDNRSTPSSSNCPLDLSMSTKKDRTGVQSARPNPVPMRAIYDIPPPKPKQCLNPAVLDKHRTIFPAANAPKQHPSFKIMASQSQGMRHNTGPCLQQTSSPGGTPIGVGVGAAVGGDAHSLDAKKSRMDPVLGSPVVSSNTNTNTSSHSNNCRHRSDNRSESRSHSNHSHNSHHHNHNHNHNSHNKTYSVITPDPHRYTPKLVIRNIGSPPSITSHFNYPTHH